MRPTKHETTRSGDLFRARLDQIINMRHELEHVPPRLNRGILSGPRMRESIGIDSLWGGGGCRRPILGTCGNE